MAQSAIEAMNSQPRNRETLRLNVVFAYSSVPIAVSIHRIFVQISRYQLCMHLERLTSVFPWLGSLANVNNSRFSKLIYRNPIMPILSSQSIGILCLIGAVALFSGNDTIIKWLSPHYALHEIMLLRSMVALSITIVIMQFEGRSESGMHILHTRRPWLLGIRALLFFLSNMLFFLGASTMPLADAVSIFFAAPIFICLLSQPLLGESVGPWRWFAISLGMIGVIIMLRPGQDGISWATLLPLGAAMTYALTQLLTRRLGATESASSLAFYVQIMFIVICVTSGLIMGDGRFFQGSNPALDFLFRAWRWPQPEHLGIILLCGCLVGFGMFLLIQAYRIASASAIAPFEYLGMPFAVFWGFQIWGDWPDTTTLVGSVLIISAGAIIIIRENRLRPSLN